MIRKTKNATVRQAGAATSIALLTLSVLLATVVVFAIIAVGPLLLLGFLLPEPWGWIAGIVWLAALALGGRIGAKQ